MEQQQKIPHSSTEHREIEEEEGGGGEYNLREWASRARMISRDNTISRRFSASNISRLREDTKSFRSNFTISSTASSPGYPLLDEIDPSTYSFTTALKALQARTGCVWECLSPEGFSLNSKWNDAEKYICNPLSGEFPMECLSAKTLSGRYPHKLPSRITMSAPLIYPSSYHMKHSQTTQPRSPPPPPVTGGKKLGVIMTRDVGIQSTPGELSWGSPSPTSTLSIAESVQSNRMGSDTRESDKPVEDKEVAAVAVEKKGHGKKERSCLSWRRKGQRQDKNNSMKRNMFLCSC